ncbi:site-specific DNA-methyltransferase [Staphylococcus pseudintermedius]|nr:site-specific DNA-methyltransferase [Staphylococcus pseudintermedius]
MVELNKIYNEDCLEGMKRIPDKSVDMILCDLPYGTTRNKWDIVIDLEKLWEQYKRVIKDNGAIALTAAQPFETRLVNSNPKMFKYDLIWKKNLPTGFLNAKRMPLRSHESVLIFYKKPPVYNAIMRKGRFRNKGNTGRKGGRCYGETKRYESWNDEYYPTSVIEVSNANQKEKIHPTQKPVELFEWLIKTYTNEGDTVLDNCIGSGTTAIACMNTGRNYIGYELDKEYYDVAIERIELAKE